MPSVQIGRRRIEYDVRESRRASRQRIEVTPAGVEVIVPEGTPDAEIDRFLTSRRRWLFDRTAEMDDAVARLKARTPTGFHSGAKVLYRGRFLKLRVEAAHVSEPTLDYATGFTVRVPAHLDDDRRTEAVRRLIEAWMDRRLLEDAWTVVRRRGGPHSLEPKDVWIRDQKTVWGSCGRDEILRLDRKLTRVPRPVFEYVVVHELCHLRHRDHSEAFWGLVGQVLPGYEERKAWLERHEVEVG